MTLSKTLISASVAALVSATSLAAMTTTATASPFTGAALSSQGEYRGTTNVWTRCRYKRVKVWSARYNCYVWKKRRVCW